MAGWVDLDAALVGGEDPTWPVAREKDARQGVPRWARCSEWYELSRYSLLLRDNTLLGLLHPLDLK